MNLTLHIITAKGGKKHYRVQDDTYVENSGIVGTGWTVREAVEDFISQYNTLAFYDDDTPRLLRRDDISLRRVSLRICS